MSRRRPVVVVAPDSFKGSATAGQIAAAMQAGVLDAVRDAEVRQCPLADGGEGSLAVLSAALGLETVPVRTEDALGRARKAVIAVSADRRLAVVEAAMANGLPHVADLVPDPLVARTTGVGLLLTAALDQGVEEIVLAIGGSASSDGGVGALTALGARFLDHDGDPVQVGAAGLVDIARIELDGVDDRWRTVTLRIAADVTNPLLGPRGTATVFAPQKGATPDQVDLIDDGLAHLAAVIMDMTGRDVGSMAGGGAAGGTPATLVGLLGARLEPGSVLIAETVGLASAVAEADLVITGEGSFDAQSLDGKVVSCVVATVARRCPVVVVAGQVDVDLPAAQQAGVSAAFSIAPGPSSLGDLVGATERLVRETASQVAALALGPQAFLRPANR